MRILSRNFLGFLFLGLAAAGGVCPGAVRAESLWDEDSQGYLQEPPPLQAGQTVFVVLSSGMSYQYEASRETDKRITLSLSGGADGADPFQFLPKGRSGDAQTGEGESQWEITGTVAASLGERRENGTYPVAGSRKVTVDGLTETISLQGYLHPRNLDSRKRVPFTALTGAELTLSSFLQDDKGVLAAQDMEALGEEGLAPEKQQELLRTYLNRFLDVVFSGKQE